MGKIFFIEGVLISKKLNQPAVQTTANVCSYNSYVKSAFSEYTPCVFFSLFKFQVESFLSYLSINLVSFLHFSKGLFSNILFHNQLWSGFSFGYNCCFLLSDSLSRLEGRTLMTKSNHALLVGQNRLNFVMFVSCPPISHLKPI